MTTGAKASSGDYVITGSGINTRVCNSPTREDATIVGAVLEALYASGAEKNVSTRVQVESTGTFCVEIKSQ